MLPAQHKLTFLAATPAAIIFSAPSVVHAIPGQINDLIVFLQIVGGKSLPGIYNYYHVFRWEYIFVIGFAAFGAWFGVTAPDSMEIARAEQKLTTNGYIWVRKSLIPHRTITHWWIIWVLAFYLFTYGIGVQGIDNGLKLIGISEVGLSGQAVLGLIDGFIIGAIFHLIGDVVNPSGIPWISPFGPNLSFGLWRSDDDTAGTLFAFAIIAITWILVWRYGF